MPNLQKNQLIETVEGVNTPVLERLVQENAPSKVAAISRTHSASVVRYAELLSLTSCFPPHRTSLQLARMSLIAPMRMMPPRVVEVVSSCHLLPNGTSKIAPHSFTCVRCRWRWEEACLLVCRTWSPQVSGSVRALHCGDRGVLCLGTACLSGVEEQGE